MKMKYFTWTLLGLILCFSAETLASGDVALLQAFRQEKDSVKRRQIFRKLTSGKKVDENILLQGIRDPDAAVKRYSLYLLSQNNIRKAMPLLHELAAQRDAVTLDLVYGCAMRVQDPKARRALLKKIASNPLRKTRAVLLARQQVSFEFYRENKRLKDSSAYDHDVQIIRSLTLPRSGWRFMPDRDKDGHKRGYFLPGISADDWKNVSLAPWKNLGFGSLKGVAWYRKDFQMVKKMDHAAVELYFPQVKNMAWVWLNGQYIGQYYGGSENGFYLDVTNEIRWGQSNILTVRVESSAPSGGILKEISVQVLK